MHGYIPYKDQESNVSYDDIIFSEDQYNRTFQDPSFGGNLVQVNRLTSGTGLMIGISLSDRNTRRILDSIRNQPLPHDNYILIQKPQFKMIDDSSPEIDQIRQKAQEYLRKFPEARMKMASEPQQIQQLLRNIYRYENNEFKKGFESLGLHLITYDKHSEIPSILNRIAAG